MGKVAQPRQRSVLLWLAFALAGLLGGLWLLFSLVPYMWIFLGANFIFVFISIVYLLEFWGKKPETLSKEFPGVTVIVSAYNSAPTIEASLKAILAMRYPKPFKVIVVDDASTDNTYAKMKKFAGKLTILRNPENKGKAASINQALKLVKTPLVACIDSDTYPECNALEKMVPLFNSPKVGAVIALVCVEKPRNFIQKIQQIEYWVSFGFWHTALGKLDGLLVTPGPMSVYSAAALRKVRGFDEGNITEDMEIALHLQAEGFQIKCTTAAKIRTEVPDTFGKLYRQRLRWLRGKIFNGWRYSKMLFNSSYGDFGRFVYPASFVNELLGVIVVSRVLLMHASNAFNMALGAFNLAGVNASALYDAGIYSNAVVNSSAFFFVFTVILWGYIVWLSFRLAGEKIHIGQLLPITVFMTVYSMFISLVYFASMLHEAVGVERKW